VPATQPATVPASRPDTQPARRRPGQDFDGRIVREILVVRPPRTETQPTVVDSDAAILGKLKTQLNKPFREAVLDEDIAALWTILKIWTRYEVEPIDGGDLRVRIVILIEPRTYDRVAWKGLEHLTEQQLRESLQYSEAQRMNDFVAESYVRQIEEKYRSEGFHHVQVTLERDDATSTLTFRIDEGPKVTIREVHFRGNVSFPGWAPLNLYQNLTSSSGIESKPAGRLGSGSPYNERTVEDDLDKLRLFYRGLGYRDARVELADRRFSADRSEVDLTFRIVEGRRYKIAAIDLEQLGTATPDPRDPPYVPRHPRAAILQEIKVKAGDWYDRDRIHFDMRTIERYYGKRGHPPKGRYGRTLTDALEVLEPREVFDIENATVKVIYRVVEGSPKRLREVSIRGNSSTQDRVIRSRVLADPGEILDLTQVDRSLMLLDATRWFTSPERPTGVRFELKPVEGKPDEVDLEIIVSEGETGQFLWGAGVSTDGGVSARFQFTKRNFDLWRGPSSWAPGTLFDEILDAKAFHGGGQELELFVAPGTEISTVRATYYDPDLFRRHRDTIGLRVQGYRTLWLREGYESDTTGGVFGFDRKFTSEFLARVDFRIDSVEVQDIAPNAPTVVWDAEGQTGLRSARLGMQWRDIDHPLRPTEGLDIDLTGELGGGPFGGEEDFYKLGLSFDGYLPIARDSLDRPHVLHLLQRFDYGHAYGDSNDLFLTERYFMGGANLRGFEVREAGPSQFGRPTGGEVRYLGQLEYHFPIVSSRQDGQLRETEFIRGLVFADWGLLGLSFDDPTFREPRVSVGFGFRILVPVVGIPIALDLGWPLVYEETDSRQVLYFSLSR
jgi:outer membrane protein insertion porin family